MMAAKDIYLSSKPLSNLARHGKVDVRKDEDQNIKLSQIMKLLIEAGYFRARVKGLSPFDKIVGGMTWCIEVCNFDVDVDLLFHDSLTIGQKIALTERIVKVLPYMKCPYNIEPHQIQGLDAIHIFPVIQWLVTQALETREEYQDDTRNIALNEFDRHYGHCLYKNKKDDMKVIKYITDIKLNYGPKRRFRRIEELGPEEEGARCLITLLEYSNSQEKPQLHLDSDTESIDEEDEDVRTRLSEKMSVDTATSTRFSSQAVSVIVDEQAEDIAKSTEHFLHLRQTDSSSGCRDLLVALRRKEGEAMITKESVKKALEEIISQEEELKLQLEKTQEKLQTLSNEIQNCESGNLAAKDETLEALCQLVEANEEARRKTSQFKEKCRQEADEIRRATSDINEELKKEDAAESATLEETLSHEKSRLTKVRSLVADKTREIETLKRLIDDVPGRAELAQYQKRFIELYNLVGVEHHQTLQFYGLYNSLADSRSYMEKEYDLLNSVLDNMDEGLATSSKLEEYIAQLKGISDGVVLNKVKLERKLNEARAERSTLASELSRLQDLQLCYAKILHLFSQEIAANEALVERSAKQ